MKRCAGVLATFLTAALVLAAAADARDTLAPRGAPDRWLPREDWVYRHWLAFDAATANRELGLAPGQLEALLFDDRRTLVALARVRGLEPGALRDRLVAPALVGVVDPLRIATLRSRAWRMMTQGHLAQHMFYHPYHGLDARANSRRLFGLGPKAYYRARLRGRTPLGLLRANGGDPATLFAGMDALFLADRDEGLRLQSTSPAAAAERVVVQRGQLACWARHSIPGTDRGHPYGEQHHLKQRRLLPRTRAQMHADERLLERFRTTLPASCWAIPDPWRGPALPPPRTDDADPDPELRTFTDPATPLDQRGSSLPQRASPPAP